jgi:hypothetical protein
MALTVSLRNSLADPWSLVAATAFSFSSTMLAQECPGTPPTCIEQFGSTQMLRSLQSTVSTPPLRHLLMAYDAMGSFTRTRSVESHNASGLLLSK